MAYIDPNIPTVDVVEQDPITGLISEANCKGVPPVVAGKFSLECQVTDLDGTGIYINTGTVALPVWTLQSANIEDNAVTTDKVLDDAITADKIATDAVGADQLADDAVDTEAIADDAVTSDKIDDGTIVEADIANNAVTYQKLAAAIQPTYVIKFIVLGSSITGSTLEGLAIGDLVMTNPGNGPSTFASVTVVDTLPADPADTDYLIVFRAATV